MTALVERTHNEDHLAALYNMEWELYLAQIPARRANATLQWYARALTTATAAAWRAFYRELYRAMLDAAAAAPRLMAVLDDDLGVRLFDEEARARIRKRLAE